MYFAVSKLTFSTQPGPLDDPQAFRALAEKIRARFKVCAAFYQTGGGDPCLAISALGSTVERLSQTLDKIASFCEDSGFGRVESEEALLDHIDHLAEIAGDENEM